MNNLDGAFASPGAAWRRAYKRLLASACGALHRALMHAAVGSTALLRYPGAFHFSDAVLQNLSTRIPLFLLSLNLVLSTPFPMPTMQP